MKTVSCTETTDGKLFKDEKVAEEHQNQLDLKKRLEAFVVKYMWYSMSISNITDELFEHAEELNDALK